MRFYTSDLHLGHENIIKYCDRPYTGAVAMDDDIMTRWNETVAPGDDVWVLGDLALGKLESGLARVTRLNGKITLVPGNHGLSGANTGLRHAGSRGSTRRPGSR
jgi:calcineurin-like phosphoesterase family protein